DPSGSAVRVNRQLLDLEAVPEPLQLGQAPVDRGLAALEAGRDLLAGVRTFGAPAGGLPLGPFTAAHPRLGRPAARCRPQVMHLDRHSSTSSTRTRWLTVKIIPRISGRSSLTTTSLMRLRPSVRSVSRWFGLRPIPERTGVTFSFAILTSPPWYWHRPMSRCWRRPARPAWPRVPPPPPATRAGPRPPPAAPASSAPAPRRGRC